MLRAPAWSAHMCRHRITGYSELGGTRKDHRVQLRREWPIRGSNPRPWRWQQWPVRCRGQERGLGLSLCAWLWGPSSHPAPAPAPLINVCQTARGGSCARWKPAGAPGCPRALAQQPGTEALGTPGCRDHPQGGDSRRETWRGPSPWFSLCVPDWSAGNRLSQRSPAPCMSAQEMFDYSFIHLLCCRWKRGRCSCGFLCPAAAWDLALARSKPNSHFFLGEAPLKAVLIQGRRGWLAARSWHAAAMTLAR